MLKSYNVTNKTNAPCEQKDMQALYLQCVFHSIRFKVKRLGYGGIPFFMPLSQETFQAQNIFGELSRHSFASKKREKGYSLS